MAAPASRWRFVEDSIRVIPLDVIGHAQRQGQYGMVKRRVHCAAGREDRASRDQQVADPMHAPIGIDHASLGIVRHAGRAHVVIAPADLVIGPIGALRHQQLHGPAPGAEGTREGAGLPGQGIALGAGRPPG